MATNYPGAVDSLTNPAAGDPLDSPSHAGQHANANDAIEAVQAELGTTPSGSESTVAARLDKIEDGTRLGTNSVGATQIANDSVDTNAIQSKAVTAAKIADDTITAAQIAANAVGSSELADNAVDTNAIADSAVTSAKIADGTIVSGDVAAGTFAAFGTVGNLLTANQAGVSLGTTEGYHPAYQCTVSASTSFGTPSIRVVSTASGTAIATTYPSNGYLSPVTAGDTYTVRAEARAEATSRQVQVQIQWIDASFAFISNSPGSVSVTDTTSAWAATQETAVAPANAVWGAVVVNMYGLASSEAHHIRRVGLWKGTGGQWAMPGVPIVGGSHIATNGAVHLSGTGTPESVVTAAPGSTWLQTDSTTDVKGWIRWVKATGTGNTGWVAGPEADTGLRRIDLLNGWTTFSDNPTGFIRRVGDRVTIRIPDLKATGASADLIYEMPVGFRPGGYESGVYLLNGGYTPAGWRALGGKLSSGDRSGTWSPFAVHWPTVDAWPASLPGTAV